MQPQHDNLLHDQATPSPPIADETSAGHDLTETVSTLAHMARFVVADLTDPSSIPHELAMIVPNIPVPVQPLLLEGATTYTLGQDLLVYPWMLPTRHYTTIATLIAALNEQVIAPAEAKAADLQRQRTRPIYGPP